MEKISKKLTISALIFIIVLSIASNVFAIATDYFTVNLPDDLYITSTGLIVDKNGNSIAVELEENVIENTRIFTENFLNNYVQLMMQSYNDKDAVKEQLVTIYGEENITDEFVEEYVNNVKVERIIEQNIVHVTKNKYEALEIYYISKYYDKEIYQKIYKIFDKSYIYTITISGTEDFITNQSVVDMIDSFKIREYTAFEEDKLLEKEQIDSRVTYRNEVNMVLKIAGIAVVVLIVIYFFYRLFKKKED